MQKAKTPKTHLERIQNVEATQAVSDIRYRHLRKAFDDFCVSVERRLAALEKDEA
jgi:hypothetical protein